MPGVLADDSKPGPLEEHCTSEQTTDQDGVNGVKQESSGLPPASGDEDITEEPAASEQTTNTDNATEHPPSGSNTGDYYSIHLVLPGVAAPLDIMLTARDAVHDLLLFALDSSDSCYRSCLSVQHNGRRLDEFIEIGSVEGLASGDTITLVEEPYSQRDAQLHVQRLKELIMAEPLAGASANEGLSLSFLSPLTRTEDGEELGNPPEFVMGSGAPPLSQFFPETFKQQTKHPECLKSLAYSPWNPPTNKRMMKGDLLYLDVTTLEGGDYFITCCPSGWYLNRSTGSEFNPTAKKTHHQKKHLVGLLSQISPLFKKGFSQIRKSIDSAHPLESVPVPYPVLTWLAPPTKPHPPVFRLNEGLKRPADETLPGQAHNWNEELQTAWELPTDTLPAKIFRERILFKIHAEFVSASVQAAVAAVNGNLQTLNPADKLKHRLFLWNNIFLSLAFDGRDHYQEFGGDAAAHAIAGADLNGVAAFERRDKRGLATLGTVLVDYRGYRVVCQSVIPGLLGREQDQSVVYGSIDAGKTIKTDPQFTGPLRAAAEDFHIRPHKLFSDERDTDFVELPSSCEVKGVVGNDGRLYAVDLFRVLPPDANYQSSPRHKMALLRPELVETYHSVKFLEFLNLVKSRTIGLEGVADQTPPSDTGSEEKRELPPVSSRVRTLQDEPITAAGQGNSPHNLDVENLLSELESAGKEITTEDFNSLPSHEAKKLPSDSETIPKELQGLPEVASIVTAALHEVGSTSSDSFQLRYNVDCLSPVVRHAEPQDVLELDRALVKAASEFLSSTMVPQFLLDCVIFNTTPLDGHALKEAMHSRGINMRYLGQVAEGAGKRQDLQHIQRLAVGEMVTRVARNKLRKYLQDCPLEASSDLIVFFLNCFLGEESPPDHAPPADPGRRARKKKPVKNPSPPTLSTAQLWAEITAELSSYYRYKIEQESLSELCAAVGLQKPSLLRELCRKTGIRLVLRDYVFAASPVITEEDLLGVWPLVKHTNYRSSEVMALMSLAHDKLASGNLLLALEMYNEAIQISIQIYGPMHTDIAHCYRQAAKVCQQLGDVASALDNQHKATVILERVLGIDHPDTVAAMVNLALYSHNAGKSRTALKLLYRARYYILLLHGQDHPEMATCDSNIAAVLLSLNEFNSSLHFFQNTLHLFKKYYGEQSLQTALTYHLMARVHSFLGDFREALSCEKAAHAIYNNKFGADHQRTQESYLCLKELTGKAVTMQKMISEITSKGATSNATYELPECWGEVVEVLTGQKVKPSSKKRYVVRKKSRKQGES